MATLYGAPFSSHLSRAAEDRARSASTIPLPRHPTPASFFQSWHPTIQVLAKEHFQMLFSGISRNVCLNYSRVATEQMKSKHEKIGNEMREEDRRLAGHRGSVRVLVEVKGRG